MDAPDIRPPDAYAIESRAAPAGVVLLALAGELDLAAAPGLAGRLAEAGAEAVRGVVLDLEGVTFIDSSALRELLRADVQLRAAGAQLVLAAAQLPVARLLELTRTSRVLTSAPTVEAALARLSG